MVIKDISKIEKNHSDGINIKNLTLKIENKTVFSDFSSRFFSGLPPVFSLLF